MQALVIDVGGTHVKVLASGQPASRQIASGMKMTARAMVAQVKRLTADWPYDVVSIGYPGPVLHGRPVAEPHNLGRGWVGFDFPRAFGRPVEIINDAAMQALGAYRGGRMLFLGLGTGLGSAMIIDGLVEPMELAHLPYQDGGTYEDYVGERGLERLGEQPWRRHVANVAKLLVKALEADDLVIGGGNARLLAKPPAGARLCDNTSAFAGGFRLWEQRSSQRRDRAFAAGPAGATPSPRRRSRLPTDGADRSLAPSRRRRSRDTKRKASVDGEAPADVVFLVDVDNTLLDNDRITADLERYLTREIGKDHQQRYWAIFERLRVELGYADYLGALQRYRIENLHEPHLLPVSAFLLDYPFESRLFPRALDVLEQLATEGRPVILSDGDVVFQPHKVERSGLFDAVEGRVLIYVHKEQELDDVERRYPAEHYVVVDDKVRILTAVKDVWGDRVTTVFPRQGHYARDPDVADYPRPDLTIARIGDLLQHDVRALTAAARRTRD